MWILLLGGVLVLNTRGLRAFETFATRSECLQSGNRTIETLQDEDITFYCLEVLPQNQSIFKG